MPYLMGAGEEAVAVGADPCGGGDDRALVAHRAERTEPPEDKVPVGAAPARPAPRLARVPLQPLVPGKKRSNTSEIESVSKTIQQMARGIRPSPFPPRLKAHHRVA
jgi:hypothetical protein